MGFLAVAAFREGRLDDHLRIGALTFHEREWADYCSAAIAFSSRTPPLGAPRPAHRP